MKNLSQTQQRNPDKTQEQQKNSAKTHTSEISERKALRGNKTANKEDQPRTSEDLASKLY